MFLMIICLSVPKPVASVNKQQIEEGISKLYRIIGHSSGDVLQFRLTAVIDWFRHCRLESSGETSITVREERREHEPNHAEVHFFRLKCRCAADYTALVV